MSAHSENTQQAVTPDYHGHPNYRNVYFLLVGLFFASLIAGEFHHPILGVGLVFLLGFIKAWAVITRFMHLKWEPKTFWWAVIFALFCMVVFYVAVYVDLIPVKIHVPQ